MTITEDDTYCVRKRTKKILYNYCIINYLKFEEDSMLFWQYTICGVVPRKTTGWIDEILNGCYDNEVLCDCSINEKNTLYINFRKEASETFIQNLTDMVDREGIDTIIRYVCED